MIPPFASSPLFFPRPVSHTILPPLPLAPPPTHLIPLLLLLLLLRSPLRSLPLPPPSPSDHCPYRLHLSRRLGGDWFRAALLWQMTRLRPSTSIFPANRKGFGAVRTTNQGAPFRFKRDAGKTGDFFFKETCWWRKILEQPRRLSPADSRVSK